MNDNYGVNAKNIKTSVLIQKVEGDATIGVTQENTPKPIDINWREVCQNGHHPPLPVDSIARLNDTNYESKTVVQP